jgi:hypothetical protein
MSKINTRHFLHAFFICGIFIFFSCKQTDNTNENGNSGGSGQTSDGKGEIVEEPEIIDEYENISSSEVYDFIDLWSNVYATNTLDSYLDLYDRSNFTGIKRTFKGQKNTYDFAGCVENKRNEFRKFKPYVEITDIKIKSLNRNNRSTVHFRQQWYSSNTDYADEGEKKLILVKKNGHILIQHEELLYSKPIYQYD